jgi:large subunit ribosomal protein L1
MPKLGKRSRDALSKIDRVSRYELNSAIELAKSVKFAKFDESVDVAVALNVDPKHADQMVRGAVALPHGLGRTVRVVVFAKGDDATAAEAAGADFVGAEDLVEKIKGGWLEFEKCIATPAMMRFVGLVGKILGPRGLMPNPKVGTVTTDVATAVREAKAGRIEFRVEKAGIVHTSIGKSSFETEKLAENAMALFDQLQKIRPSTVKGTYFKKITVSTTMGPGIKVDEAAIVNTLTKGPAAA